MQKKPDPSTSRFLGDAAWEFVHNFVKPPARFCMIPRSVAAGVGAMPGIPERSRFLGPQPGSARSPTPRVFLVTEQHESPRPAKIPLDRRRQAALQHGRRRVQAVAAKVDQSLVAIANMLAVHRPLCGQPGTLLRIVMASYFLTNPAGNWILATECSLRALNGFW